MTSMILGALDLAAWSPYYKPPTMKHTRGTSQDPHILRWGGRNKDKEKEDKERCNFQIVLSIKTAALGHKTQSKIPKVLDNSLGHSLLPMMGLFHQ